MNKQVETIWKTCEQCNADVIHDEFGSADKAAVYFCDMTCVHEYIKGASQ